MPSHIDSQKLLTLWDESKRQRDATGISENGNWGLVGHTPGKFHSWGLLGLVTQGDTKAWNPKSLYFLKIKLFFGGFLKLF